MPEKHADWLVVMDICALLIQHQAHYSQVILLVFRHQLQQSLQTQQQIQQAKLQQVKQVNEDVKAAIKKTVEKYYNQGKK